MVIFLCYNKKTIEKKERYRTMGKQWLSFLLALLFFIPTLFGYELPFGANGKSAYEIACENGFEGDYREWLASLEGKDGIQEITTVIQGAEDITAQAASKALCSAVSVRTEAAGGSGVIMKLDKETGEAYVITNHHVVYNGDTASKIAEEITVYLYGSEYAEYAIPATYVGGSMQYDLAVLHVASSELMRTGIAQACEFSEVRTPIVGQRVLAVGNAKGKGISVTSGIVSVESEQITMTAVDEVTTVTYRSMRIDANINSGNSGGGLYNSAGKLIGIVNAKHMETNVEGIGYAIPLSIVRAVTDNIMDTCDGEEHIVLRRVFLGAMVRVTDTQAAMNAESGTVYIKEVNRVEEIVEGALCTGILQVGDTFLSIRIDDRAPVEILRQHHLLDEILYAREGSTVHLSILRDGETLNLTMEIPTGALQEY